MKTKDKVENTAQQRVTYPVGLIWQIATVNIIIVFILSNFSNFMTSISMLLVIAGLMVGDLAVFKLVELVKKKKYKWTSFFYFIIPCEFVFVFCIITLIRNSLVAGEPSVDYKNFTLKIIFVAEMILLPYAIYMMARLKRFSKENEELDETDDLEFKPESPAARIIKGVVTIILVICFILAVASLAM